MNQNEDINPPAEDPAEAPTVETRGPRRLLRSKNDRVIAGVAGGLGRYFNIDPVILRIAFAVSVLFWGFGVVAYLALALFVPSDDGTGVAAPSSRMRGVAQALGIALLAIAVVSGFGVLVAIAAFVTGIGYGLAVVGAIVLIGIALIALSFRGGAKWLIVPALALSIGVAAASASDLDLKGGVGERDYRPASAAAIPANGYQLGVGRLAVDLRGIDWNADRVLDLDVRLGAGDAVIVVPSDVCVVADAHAGAGNLRIAGQQADGADVNLLTGDGSRATPQLRLNADVDLGQIRVLNDDSAVITDRGGNGVDASSRDGDPVARAANAKACGA